MDTLVSFVMNVFKIRDDSDVSWDVRQLGLKKFHDIDDEVVHTFDGCSSITIYLRRPNDRPFPFEASCVTMFALRSTARHDQHW